METKAISVETRNRLQEMVGEIKFALEDSKLQRFKCRNCNQVAVIPQKLRCSHVICSNCLIKCYRSRCPVANCNNRCISECSEDKSFEDTLSKLKVFCAVCNSPVTLWNLLDHQDACKIPKDMPKESLDLDAMSQMILTLQARVTRLEDELKRSTIGIKGDIFQSDNLQDTILKIVRQELKKQRTVFEDSINELVTNVMQQKMKVPGNEMQDLESQVQPSRRNVIDRFEKMTPKDGPKKLQSKTSPVSSNINQGEMFKRWDSNEVQKWRGSTSRLSDIKTDDSSQVMLSSLLKKLNENCLNLKKEINDSLKQDMAVNLDKERKVLLEKMKSQITTQMREVKRSTIQDAHDIMDTKFKSNKAVMEKSLMTSLKTYIDKRMTPFTSNDRVPSYKNRSLNKNKSLSMSNLKTQDETTRLQGDIRLLEKKLEKFMGEQVVLSWTVPDVLNEVKGNLSKVLYSEVYTLHELGCKLKFTCQFSPYVEFTVTTLDSQFENTSLHYYYSVTFMILDQSDSDDKQDIIRFYEPDIYDQCNDSLFHIIWGNPCFVFEEPYMKDGQIAIKIMVEPLYNLLKFDSCKSRLLIWKIDNYKEIMRKCKIGLTYLLSESFYTCEKGHRMKAFLYVGEDVIFNLFFLKGPWDGDLPNTFPHQTTLTVISQNGPGELLDRSFSKESNRLTFDDIINFMTEAELNKYVKNDSLILNVRVDPL